MQLLETTCPRTGKEIYSPITDFQAVDAANDAIIEQAMQKLGYLPKTKTCTIRKKISCRRIFIIKQKTDEETDEAQNKDINEAQSDAYNSFRREQFYSF